MDYVVFVLIAVVVSLGVVALLGHALWLIGAEILKPLFAPPPHRARRGATTPSPAHCPACGRKVLPREEACLACGLDLDGAAAAELRELECTARRLQALRDSDALDAATCDRVYKCVEARQRLLIEDPDAALPVRAPPAARPTVAAPVPAVVTPLTVAEQLDRLLGNCPDVRNLTPGNRQQALSWYRRLSEAELRELSPQALLWLARLLRMAALMSRSFGVYRLLLETHPAAPCAAEAALEAAQFAWREKVEGEARWFLERALLMPLGEEARRSAEELLRSLVMPPTAAPSAAEVIPQALPVAPAPPSPPRPPRRPLGQLLAAFMEERNILWGELVGGLLIVGCSIALVISLWQTLEQIPYFPFLIFAAITAALFGAGLYTLSHWKLESTSRGLLVIATLLVPLNFFILAGLYRGSVKDALDLAIEAAALAAFAGLLLLAARPLLGPTAAASLGRADRLLAPAVLGPCAVQLFIPRVLDVETPLPWAAVLLALAAVLCYGLSLAPALVAAARRERLDGRLAGRLLLLVGLATFALAVALGFFIYRSAALLPALQRLSVQVALAGIPILAAGLLLHRKLAAEPPTAAGGDADVNATGGLAAGVARTLGTAVALAGSLLMLVALVLAWPVPLALLLVGALNFAVLEAAAVRGRLPLALVPGLLCLAVGYLVGLHLLHGNLALTDGGGALLTALAVSPLSGSGLVLLALGLAGAGEWLARTGRRTEGLFHVAGAAAVAVFSMAVVVSEGTATPARGAVVFGAYAAAALAVNLRWRQRLLTFAGSGLLFLGIVYALIFLDADLSWPRLLLLALLDHASLALAGALFLRRLRAGGAQPSAVEASVFVVPLWRTGLASSFLAPLAIVPAVGWDWLAPLALSTAWLAAIWLVVAWWDRRPDFFAAFQAALTLAVLFGATRWLQGQAWFANDLTALLDPRGLHACGIALALLALVWVAARLTLRPSRVAQALFNPPWPPVDWVVLNALVITQLVLAVRALVPGVLEELVPSGRLAATDPAAGLLLGPSAWVWLGVLLVVLVAGLWERHTREVVFGLVVTAATAAVLGAGRFFEDGAANVALRWGLAGAYLAGAVLLWLRAPLSRLAARLGIQPEEPAYLPRFARDLLLAACAMPVLALTLIVAQLGFAGRPPAPPHEGSFFAEVGWVAAQVVPLILLSMAMARYGAREPSAGYAFSGGLIAVVALAGGYALGVVSAGGQLGGTEQTRILQFAAGGAAAWLLLWLPLWRRLVPTDSGAKGWRWPTMLTVQAWLAAAALAAVLVTAVGWLTLRETGGASYPPPSPWTVEAGSPLGWLALILVAAGAVTLGRQRDGVVGSHTVGLTGLAACALLACSVEGAWPGWGYRTLMIGWGAFALGWALTPDAGAMKTEFLCATGLLALALAVRAAVVFQDHLWAAAATVLIALASATLAVRKRREVWAFTATAALVLAASLVVWHANRAAALDLWWVALLQVQLLTAGVSAVVWLRLRDRIYPEGVRRVSAAPLLATLTAACFIGNAWLLGTALVPLLLFPGGALPLFVEQAGHVAGWLALLPTLAAVIGYTRRAAPQLLVHALGGGGLLLGILAACSAHRLAGPGSWLPQHLLTVAWTAVALVILTASWVGSALFGVGPAFWAPERRALAAARLGELFPVGASRRWVEGVGLLVVALALRGAWGDPARPYWSAAATVSVSALLGVLALWSRRPLHVYASGLLLCVVSFLGWKAWVADRIEGMVGVVTGEELFATFVSAQVLGLTAAAALWVLLDLGLRRRAPVVDLRGGVLPFCHAASLAAVHLLAFLILTGLASDLSLTGLHFAGPLAWVALTAVVAALGLALRDPDGPRWGVPLAPLYVAGLLGVGLALHGAALAPARLCETAALAVAGYALLASAVAAYRGWPGLFARLGIPEPAGERQAGWLLDAQGLLAALVVGVSLWACVALDTPGDRLTGPLSVALLVPAAVLLAGRWAGLAGSAALAASPDLPRYAALGLGALAVVEAACAAVDPAGPVPWLERTALVTATLTALGALGLLPRPTEWGACARRLTPALLGLACVALAALLGQEVAHYDPAPAVHSTPLTLVAVCLVVLSVAGLGAIGIWWAVAPHRDPLGLSERRRRLYVYGAELLLVVLLLHLRLNGLEAVLRRLGAGWTLAVMAVAFAGVGLGEWFGRRGLAVLAEPLRRTGLFLPLLPLLAFLLQPLTELDAAAARALPGLQVLRHNLDRLAGLYGLQALVWFLLGGLYLLAALTRRSSALGLLAALAVNFGLWVLFAHHAPLAFLVHPQVWLIPLALIVLAAEHVNRDRLTRAQGLSLRYLGLLLLYVSSTADMFIAGLGNSVLLPLLLAVLSVLGVLAGIVLRVRAFLFLGVTFLFLVIFAQIWHAAVDRAQTWVWWASGIVLGALILAVFALFEKRRNDVLKMIEDIKRWQ